MAATRIIPIHAGKKKSVVQTLMDCLNYGKNPDKTADGELVSAYGCDKEMAAFEFAHAWREYQQQHGRRGKKNDIILFQVRQSFKPGEITPQEANRIGQEFTKRFTKGNHAFVVCTHIDKGHIHNHIYWNPISLDGKKRFRDFFLSFLAVRKLSDLICMEHQLSVIQHPRGHGKSYNKWQEQNGTEKGKSNRDLLREAIDRALFRKPKTFDDFLRMMQEQGYTAVGGKYLAFSHARQERNIRLRSLGEFYSQEHICAVIAGERRHVAKVPDGKKLQTSQYPTLLSEIEAKINAGKGYGYTKWAKTFQVKQMAQSILYLQEHNFANSEELQNAANDAARKYNELSARIKETEARMTKISVLRTHIINYIKTRDVYAEYRKSGYSPKYLATHEGDIAICKAAKKAFDELGLKKLPTVKRLQEEYAKLLTQKKSDYAEYHKLRKEMRDLQVHAANIDYILHGKESQNAKTCERREQEK